MKKKKPTITGLSRKVKELEALCQVRFKEIQSLNQSEKDRRLSLAHLLEMHLRTSYGEEIAPEWGDIRAKISGLKERVLAEGQLLPFVERGYIRENQKLWHLVRAFINDPTLPKPNEKNIHTMENGAFAGEDKADFSRG